MNAKEFLRILWRRRLVALLVAALVMAGGLGFLAAQHKVWQSQSSVALLPVSTNPYTLPVSSSMVTTLIPTYLQLITSQSFLDEVAGSLSFHTTGKELQGEVHAEAIANAGIVKIVADMPSPQQALEVAQTATTDFLNHLCNNGVVSLRVLDNPTLPSSPV